MRIPNKFNGYSADNRRIYNDPATIVATLGSYADAAAVAQAVAAAEAAKLAAAAAATEAATTAPAVVTPPPVTETLTNAAAGTAADATTKGIMQGMAGNAPVGPVAPLQAAGSNAATTAGASPATTAGASPATTAGGNPFVPPGVTPPPTAQALSNPLGNPFAPPGVPPPNVNPSLGSPFAPQPPAAGPVSPVQETPSVPPGAKTLLEKTGNGLVDGFNAAKKFVVDTAGKAYEAYQKAPMPVQALGAMSVYQNYMAPKPEERPKYKARPHAGLSPDFQAGGPSPYLYGFASGGITGPVEQMSQQNMTGNNTMYPMATTPHLDYASLTGQRPVSENVLDPEGDTRTDPYTGEPRFASGGSTDDEDEKDEAELRKRYARMLSPEVKSTGVTHHTEGFGIIPRSRIQALSSPNTAAQAELAAMMKKYGIKATMPKVLDPQDADMGVGAANGGVMYGLGGYSDGGRLLKGPGDGVSDSIPASIGNRQPARLADGEFVIPARIVSELGNGSTEAGARQLYAMMERVQAGRKKSIGKNKVAVDSKAKKHLPA